jgi:hypothetical protein
MFATINEKDKIIENKYLCEKCNFNTLDKTDYNRHIQTLKHKKNQNYLKCSVTINEKNIEKKSYSCDCGKIYGYRQSLNVHKKKCQNNKKEIIISANDETDNKDLILKLLQQNIELQTKLAELLPNLGHTTNINNTINANVNIQIYLNENCKNAMTLEDFVKGINVNVSDLLLTKKKGLIEGITSLMLNHLDQLPFSERPLWCSDKKRKRLYIKEDTWKEDINHIKTREAIYNVSKVQCRNIKKFIDDKPDWLSHDKVKDDYMELIKSVTDSMENKVEKVIDKLIDNIHFSTNNLLE